MKRAAAILGATPPFIRWAIEAACPFLRLESPAAASRNPAQSRWRQLRGLKEVSLGIAQGRTHAGFCFSAQATAEKILGVRIEEVTAPLGGSPRVAQACRQCRANPNPLSDAWAPCTGLLPLSQPGPTCEETTSRWQRERDEFSRRIAETVHSGRHGEPLHGPLTWSSIWRGPSLEGLSLTAAHQTLALLADQFSHATAEYQELTAALQHASVNKLKVWIESVPAGWSDGQLWRLPAHCSGCGATWTGSAGGRCVECGAESSFQAERRLKVLGLRPFVQLTEVLGEPAARQLFLEYHSSRVSTPDPKPLD